MVIRCCVSLIMGKGSRRGTVHGLRQRIAVISRFICLCLCEHITLSLCSEIALLILRPKNDHLNSDTFLIFPYERYIFFLLQGGINNCLPNLT